MYIIVLSETSAYGLFERRSSKHLMGETLLILWTRRPQLLVDFVQNIVQSLVGVCYFAELELA
jgi:hypothetical protein